jgi:hypothetical protein
MNYNELNTLLDSLLEAESLPKIIEHADDIIRYHRRSRLLILTKSLFRLAQAELFYTTHLRKQLRHL